MKIKKLSEDKVKVLIESEDIHRYKVPYHRLSTADEQSAEFIYEILFLIFEQTGVSFLECAVSLEATLAYGGNYYITVTKNQDPDGSLHLTKGDDDCGEIYIFETEKLVDILQFTKLCKNLPILPIGDALYKYGKNYYVILEFTAGQIASEDFPVTLIRFSEFLTPCKASIENEGLLLERGQLICRSLMETFQV